MLAKANAVLVAVVALALLTSRAAATSQFLVVQKEIVNNPLDHDSLSVEDHASIHFSEVLKAVRAAFTVRPAPKAAVFVDSGPDPTLHGQRDHRRMLRGIQVQTVDDAPVLLSAQPLRPHAQPNFGDDVRNEETKAGAVNYRAAKLARSFFTQRVPGYNLNARVALAKANGDR